MEHPLFFFILYFLIVCKSRQKSQTLLTGEVQSFVPFTLHCIWNHYVIIPYNWVGGTLDKKCCRTHTEFQYFGLKKRSPALPFSCRAS